MHVCAFILKDSCLLLYTLHVCFLDTIDQMRTGSGKFSALSIDWK